MNKLRVNYILAGNIYYGDYKIYKRNSKHKESVITIGNFDGVHKGHQVLIGKTVEHAKKKIYRVLYLHLQIIL